MAAASPTNRYAANAGSPIAEPRPTSASLQARRESRFRFVGHRFVAAVQGVTVSRGCLRLVASACQSTLYAPGASGAETGTTSVALPPAPSVAMPVATGLRSGPVTVMPVNVRSTPYEEIKSSSLGACATVPLTGGVADRR